MSYFWIVGGGWRKGGTKGVLQGDSDTSSKEYARCSITGFRRMTTFSVVHGWCPRHRVVLKMLGMRSGWALKAHFTSL